MADIERNVRVSLQSDTSGGDDTLAYMARLKQMSREAADQAKSDLAETAAARREGTAAIADHIVKVREQIAAEKEAAAAGDDTAAYYARLKQMSQEAAAQVKQDQEATAAARRAGTEAIVAHVQAVQREAQAQREAADAAKAPAAARQEQVATFNKLIGLTTVSAAEVQKDTQAQRDHAAAIRSAAREYDGLNTFLVAAAEHERTAYRSRGEVVALTGRAADANRRYGSSVDAAAKSTTNLGYAGLTAGRAIQDFTQGGLGGILNNIEGLAMALGGGGALAGGLTTIGVGLFIFKDQIKDAFNYFTGQVENGKSRLEQFKATVETVNAKPLKLVADLQSLENAKQQVESIERSLKAVEALGQQRAPIIGEAGDRVAGILNTAIGGGAQLKERLIDAAVNRAGPDPQAEQMRRELEATQERRAVIGRLPAAAQGPGTADELRRAEARITELQLKIKESDDARVKAATREVGDALAGAKEGDARGREALAGQLRGVGENELADRVLAATPANLIGEKLAKVWDKFAEQVQEAGGKAAAKATDQAGDREFKGWVAEQKAFFDEPAKQAAAGKRDDAEAARQAKEQAKGAKEAAREATVTGLQQSFPVSREQAETIAPQVERDIARGADPVVAARAAVLKLEQLLQAGQMKDLEAQALFEAMNGKFDGAVQQLQMQRAWQQNFRQRLGNVGGGMRPALLPQFAPAFN